MKYLCFRFDVDTHKCLRDGVPNLLKLAELHNIKFTFFINTGRSIDRLNYVRGKVKNSKGLETVKSLSALKKLGVKEYLYVALINPVISQNYPQVIDSIYQNGHEIGLHGGKNHQLWHSFAHLWNQSKIEEEVNWGIMQLKNINKKIPLSGFSSPGWNCSDRIDKVLQKKGFKYSADIHTNTSLQKITVRKNFKNIPTNITGEPGGVGYIEHCRALGMDDKAIVNDFISKLKQRERLAIMYDHPYYVGVQELPLLNKLIKKALAMNYKFVTMDHISKNV